MRYLNISAKLPGATLVVGREIVDEADRLTTFRHSAWLEGPCARLFRRPLRQRFLSEAPHNMRRLAHLADDSGPHQRNPERFHLM